MLKGFEDGDNVCDQLERERFVLKRCCGNCPDNSMHIAVHPANNKDDDEDEDGKDDDDNEEEEQDGDVVASNTSPQGHAFKTQLINIAESENKITRRGSFKAKTVTDLLFCLST